MSSATMFTSALSLIAAVALDATLNTTEPTLEMLYDNERLKGDDEPVELAMCVTPSASYTIRPSEDADVNCAV